MVNFPVSSMASQIVHLLRLLQRSVPYRFAPPHLHPAPAAQHQPRCSTSCEASVEPSATEPSSIRLPLLALPHTTFNFSSNFDLLLARHLLFTSASTLC